MYYELSKSIRRFCCNRVLQVGCFEFDYVLSKEFALVLGHYILDLSIEGEFCRLSVRDFFRFYDLLPLQIFHKQGVLAD